jgi:putative SOS response-associated peptidase YedK
VCGRFTLADSAHELLRALGIEVGDELAPRYNIAPTQVVAAVANRAPRRLERFRWGLVPAWAKDPSIGNRMINARVETLAEKPSFATPLARRRCLVLADGFYEWRRDGGKKTPVHIRLPSREPFAFAGLWEEWRPAGGEAVASCTIVTTAADATLAAVHDRMPVVLPRERHDAWLDPSPRSAADALRVLADLPPLPWAIVAVSPRVNSPAFDGPECLAPVA